MKVREAVSGRLLKLASDSLIAMNVLVVLMLRSFSKVGKSTTNGSSAAVKETAAARFLSADHSITI